jgi:hypothetical protein
LINPGAIDSRAGSKMDKEHPPGSIQKVMPGKAAANPYYNADTSNIAKENASRRNIGASRRVTQNSNSGS